MISVDEAIKKVLSSVKPLDYDEIPSINAVGYVLAEDIESDIDMPPFNRATMDGYALRSKDSGPDVELKVDSVVAAGEFYSNKIEAGHAVKIMTGAPVPSGCDAVIQIEETSEPRKGYVKLKSKIAKGKNIAFKGEEIQKGEVVLKKGTMIDAIVSSVLAQAGFTKVKVYQRPNVLILVTGTELVEPDEMPRPGQIRESNSFGLLAQCATWGATGVRAGYVVDSSKDLEKELKAIFKLAPDVLLITGGVSVGDYDLVPKILAKLGADIIFHSIAQKPGKPMLFAKHDRTFIFGLPGNPVASYLGFELYAGPAIKLMGGEVDYKTQFYSAKASGDFRVVSDRDYFHPAKVSYKDDSWYAEPVFTHGSADVRSLVEANAFVHFEKGKYIVSKGSDVRFFFLRGKSYGT